MKYQFSRITHYTRRCSFCPFSVDKHKWYAKHEMKWIITESIH